MKTQGYCFTKQAVSNGFLCIHPINSFRKKESITCPAHSYLVFRQKNNVFSYYHNTTAYDKEVFLNKKFFPGIDLPFLSIFKKTIEGDLYFVRDYINVQKYPKENFTAEAGSRKGVFSGWAKFEAKVTNPITPIKFLVDKAKIQPKYTVVYSIDNCCSFAIHMALIDAMNKGNTRDNISAQMQWYRDWKAYLKSAVFTNCLGCELTATDLFVSSFRYL